MFMQCICIYCAIAPTKKLARLDEVEEFLSKLLTKHSCQAKTANSKLLSVA